MLKRCGKILFSPLSSCMTSTTSYAQWSASRLGQAATPSGRYPPSSSSRILSRAELDTPSRPRNQLLEEQVEIERRLEESRQRARERQSQLDQAKSASISAARFTTPVRTQQYDAARDTSFSSTTTTRQQTAQPAKYHTVRKQQIQLPMNRVGHILVGRPIQRHPTQDDCRSRH